MTADTVLTGASLSKPLTAVAALSLVDSGVLALDRDANEYLEDWQISQNELTAEEGVTLRRLLGHRAGVRNDLWSSYLPDDPVPTLLQMLAGQPPSVDPPTEVTAVPGGEQRYSNPGYSIIQKILEDVQDEDFERILEARVLRPSGMTDTSFDQPIPKRLMARRATGYEDDLSPYPYRLFPYQAAGGVWTTPEDMAAFVIALFKDLDGGNTLLSQAMAEQVFRRDRDRLAFAKVYDDSSDDLVFRHYGSNQGFTCYLVGSIQNRQAVVVMTNSDNGFGLLDYIARAVAEYHRWDHLQPTFYAPFPLERAVIREYEGEFDDAGERLSFRLAEASLWLASARRAVPEKLIAVGEAEFISSADSTKYEFYRPRGSSTGVFQWVRVITPSGQDNYAERETGAGAGLEDDAD